MKNFKFKGNTYDITKLIIHHYDESLKDFNEGTVEDTSSGEIFDIEDMFSIYKTNIYDLLNNTRNFSSSQEQHRIKSIYEKQIKGIRISILQSKLDEDTITLKEIEEWITLMSYKDRGEFGVAKYSNYITINHAKPKPKGLSRNDYSRFFEIIYIMSYRNEVTYSSNGKPIKRKDLMGLLDFSSLSGLDKFINKLKKFNMIIRTEPNHNKVSFLMINPAYAMRQIVIDLTTYNYFREDLDELLTPLEKKYIELKGHSKTNNHMLLIES